MGELRHSHGFAAYRWHKSITSSFYLLAWSCHQNRFGGSGNTISVMFQCTALPSLGILGFIQSRENEISVYNGDCEVVIVKAPWFIQRKMVLLLPTPAPSVQTQPLGPLPVAMIPDHSPQA
jgi:hypothetical protein